MGRVASYLTVETDYNKSIVENNTLNRNNSKSAAYFNAIQCIPEFNCDTFL